MGIPIIILHISLHHPQILSTAFLNLHLELHYQCLQHLHTIPSINLDTRFFEHSSLIMGIYQLIHY